MSGNVLKHGLSCLIYYRKRNTNDARLSPPKMKRDVKFLSNESVLHLHEKKKTSHVKRILHERFFVQGSLLREE